MFEAVAVRALRVVKTTRDQLVAYGAAARALTSPDAGPVILRQVSGAIRFDERPYAAVYCHYDDAGKVSASSVAMVRALNESGCATVVVSGSPALEDTDISRWTANCTLVLHRRNVGYDFGAYKHGVALVPNLRARQGLVLANDSMLGPFAPLSTLVSQCNGSADAWGMTESFERSRHLQSYFLLLRQPVLQSGVLQSVFERYVMANSKEWAIEAGELGLSRAMTRAGLRLRALFPQESIHAAFWTHALGVRPKFPLPGAKRGLPEIRAMLESGLALNPTHYFWRVLIEDLGFPFIKRLLVDRNPGKLESVDEWREIAIRRFGASVDTDLFTTRSP